MFSDFIYIATVMPIPATEIAGICVCLWELCRV